MKIGVITIHYNTNFGAVLQACATLKILRELGHEPQLINYINPYGAKEFKLWQGGVVTGIRTLFYLKQKILRIKRFSKFIKDNYSLTERFDSCNALQSHKFDFDVYMTGSDQTFNLALVGNKEIRKVYFLPWIENKKKISYASSLGEHIASITMEDKAWMKQALSQYSNLAVREKSSADFIESLGLKRPDVVLDPTLLVPREDWEALEKPIPYETGKYILFYSVVTAPWVIKEVQNIAKKLNLKVVAPHLKNRFELNTGFIRASDCGPGEFLSLVKNAAFVCTSSFHGSVFAIIYNKPFVSFLLSEGNRLSHLLDCLGLTMCAKRKGDIISMQDLTSLDFPSANKRLLQERQRSISILQSYLQ